MKRYLVQNEVDLKKLYICYLIVSWVFAVMAFVWIMAIYVFNWQETMTLFDLFKILLLGSATFYFRWNAYQYQTLWQRSLLARRQRQSLKQPKKPVRGGRVR